MKLSIRPKDIDLTNKRHLSVIIQAIESPENVRRKKDAYKAYECVEGRQKEHVKDELCRLYPNTHTKFRVGNVNVIQKIARKKSKAYKTTPVRKLKRESDTKYYSEIHEDNKFSRSLKEADKIYNTHKYVALRVSYSDPKEGEKKGSYNLHALAPYDYDLILDELGNPIVFILSQAGTYITGGSDNVDQVTADDTRDKSANKKTYYIWSKDNYVEVVAYNVDRETTISNLKVQDNIIKRLPIAFLATEKSSAYPVPSDLAQKSIDWNVEFSDLKTASATQGHGQLVISHPEKKKMAQMHMGMHTAINLPQSMKAEAPRTTAEYISANPDLSGQLEVLKFSLTQILDDEGIVAKSSIEGGVDKVASGFDRLLKEADVQDVVEDNQELYADNIEQEIYNIVQAFEMHLNTQKLKSPKLMVTFPKPTVLISDKETLDNIEKRESLGLLLPHEKHQIINPNLTDDEAIKREQEIEAKREEKAKKMQSLLGDDEEETQDDE